MGQIGRLIADLGGDDLPPHGRFPGGRPFNLAAEQFRVGGPVIGQGDGARLKFLIANQQQHIQFCHAPQRTGGKLRVPRGAHDGRNIRQRHGFIRAAVQIGDVKLVKLQPHPQVMA